MKRKSDMLDRCDTQFTSRKRPANDGISVRENCTHSLSDDDLEAERDKYKTKQYEDTNSTALLAELQGRIVTSTTLDTGRSNSSINADVNPGRMQTVWAGEEASKNVSRAVQGLRYNPVLPKSGAAHVSTSRSRYGWSDLDDQPLQSS